MKPASKCMDMPSERRTSLEAKRWACPKQGVIWSTRCKRARHTTNQNALRLGSLLPACRDCSNLGKLPIFRTRGHLQRSQHWTFVVWPLIFSDREGLFVTPIATVFRMTVGVQPAQQTANAALRQSNTGIVSAAIEIDTVPIRRDGIAAGKYDVLDISVTLVFRLVRKHPGIPAGQTFVGFLKIEESQT